MPEQPVVALPQPGAQILHVALVCILGYTLEFAVGHVYLPACLGIIASERSRILGDRAVDVIRAGQCIRVKIKYDVLKLEIPLLYTRKEFGDIEQFGIPVDRAIYTLAGFSAAAYIVVRLIIARQAVAHGEIEIPNRTSVYLPVLYIKAGGAHRNVNLLEILENNIEVDHRRYIEIIVYTVEIAVMESHLRVVKKTVKPFDLTGGRSLRGVESEADSVIRGIEIICALVGTHVALEQELVGIGIYIDPG